MAVWAIGDLHLSFGTPEKKMDVFGTNWKDHPKKIEAHWREKITADDLILIPGDISWSKHIDGAMPDLEWIDSLPGTKVMIRGNHDYWWSSLKRLREIMPPSIHVIQNDTFTWNNIIVGGARLWDNPEYNFNSYIPYFENPVSNPEAAEVADSDESERIFERELHRLTLSLEQMQNSDKLRIAMTHYPPISADLHPSRVSKILEAFGVKICVFGHLHNVHTHLPMFGEKNGIRFILTSADYIDFNPVQVL